MTQRLITEGFPGLPTRLSPTVFPGAQVPRGQAPLPIAAASVGIFLPASHWDSANVKKRSGRARRGKTASTVSDFLLSQEARLLLLLERGCRYPAGIPASPSPL